MALSSSVRCEIVDQQVAWLGEWPGAAKKLENGQISAVALEARDSRAALDGAVASLGRLRVPTGWLGDAGAGRHLLVSLSEAAERQLPGTLPLVRDQDCSWVEIGDRLGMTRAAARQRFGDQVATAGRVRRREPLANAACA